MSTKGPSNRYGNAKYGLKGHITLHTGFAWAKNFLNHTFLNHVRKHMKTLGLSSPEAFRAHAVAFANKVDRVNHISYVRRNGETVKFSKKTGEFAIITKKGKVTTYFKPEAGIEYYYDDRRKHR